jgi:molybdopterin/thiamine biosynthesis adenylyltransferase
MVVAVLIVGAGGIGSSAILYLAGAGIGSLTLVDFDVVEESNLHRQVIHDTAAAHNATHKATSAAARVKALNPYILCDVIQDKLTRSNAVEIMTQKPYDLVVDATDNFEARYLINDSCNHVGLPLVSGSAGKKWCGSRAVILYIICLPCLYVCLHA